MPLVGLMRPLGWFDARMRRHVDRALRNPTFLQRMIESTKQRRLQRELARRERK